MYDLKVAKKSLKGVARLVSMSFLLGQLQNYKLHLSRNPSVT